MVGQVNHRQERYGLQERLYGDMLHRMYDRVLRLWKRVPGRVLRLRFRLPGRMQRMWIRLSRRVQRLWKRVPG